MFKTYLIIVFSVFFISACSFPWTQKTTQINDVSVSASKKNKEIISDKTNKTELEKAKFDNSKDVLKYELILPDQEKETQNLLDEYENNLDNLNNKIKK